jgi:hypothetical protein
MVLEAVRSEPTCRRLMSVPGVGALTAITYVTTIDDPDRFNRSRDVGAHLGLTPRKYASGEIDRNGAISKMRRRAAQDYSLSGSARIADAHSTLVYIEGMGRCSRQAAWPQAGGRRSGAQARNHASHLGRRQRVSLVSGGGDRMIGF